MKSKFSTLFLCLLFVNVLYAQTWNGSASTDWNTAANWSTNAVPIATGNVTIPNTVNKPVLANNVTIASLTTAAGSGINFNGFTLSATGASNIVGATLSNSNGATDIVVTLGSGGAGNNFIGSTTFTDNVTINFNSSSPSYEGFTLGNVFSGNAIFNINGTGTFYSSYSQKCSYGGSLTVNRTAAGITDLFTNGFNFITGNFSYTNTVGGNTLINNSNLLNGPINGTVNITATGAGNPTFTLLKIKNLTTGGTISVQNSGTTSIQNDTVAISVMNVTGFTGAGSDEMRGNSITGNVTFAEAATNTGSVFVGNNSINGNTTLGNNSAAIWYEGFTGICIYNGNTIFDINGTGTFYSSYNQKCSYSGNLTITRTAAGITDLFTNGFNFITGNFSYTNSAGGNTLINNSSILNGPINGTVNITATGAGNPTFTLRKIKNLTTGGTIIVQNSGTTSIQNDTLAISVMNVTGFTGAGSDEMSGNSITGNITFVEAATNTGSVFVGNNSINGNTTLGNNSAAIWYEGFTGICIYNGNTIFNINGTGAFNSSYNQKCSFGGNLTVNRTAAGITDLFTNGFNFITGNFSYTNTAGGNTLINSGNILNGPINGTVNITATGAGNPSFSLRKIKNLTTGGNISVQNSGTTSILNDTLAISVMNVTGFTGAGSDEMSGNSIAGTVTFAEAASNTSSVFVGNNSINGNTNLTATSVATWYEGFLGSNIYNGNVTFSKSGASEFNIAYSDTTYVNQNISLNASAGFIVTNAIEFGGSTNGAIEQISTQPINLPRLIMKKTGAATLTLNDSVTVTATATFTSGNIISSTLNQLKFLNDATQTNASATSHVIGPVTKVGDDIFTFPVGGPLSFNPIGMSAPVGATSRFSAQYKNQNPTSDGFNTSLKAGSFSTAAISKAAYWDVKRLEGVTNVTLKLGFGTNPYEQYPAALANLKVAHWNSTQWDDHGNAAPTGSAASGSINNSVAITSFSPFTLAGATSTYHYAYSNPGAGPDGTPVKFRGIGGYPAYQTKQLPAGSYTTDSIYLIPNASTASFKLKDFYNVEKDDTTVTAPIAPTTYIAANGNGTVNFVGWRHFVYVKNGSNEIIGAIKDNDLTLGNTTMRAYFSTASVATAPNGNKFLKRSFKITSQFAPVGIKRVRFYISKTEFNNLLAADPTSFPSGINSLTITRYTGPVEDSLFNPMPIGVATIIPTADITIVDLGTMYSLDIDVTGFSGFYIGGNQSQLNICKGSTISLPSNISGTTYQWQVDAGAGYTNITDGVVYSGTATKTFTLTNTPASVYGYKFRCVVNGASFSQVYTVKLNTSWEGNVSNVWENVANWSCGVLPDAGSDVVIDAGKANYPQVNVSTSVRTITVNTGGTMTVKTGATITVIK